MPSRPASLARSAKPAAPASRKNHNPFGIDTRLRRALLSISLLIGLVPLPAGPQGSLILPVHYGRIALSDRSPVLLNLGLPGGEFFVSPSSLGYFTEDNRFVYTGEVARGLIYGRMGENPIVYEVSAPGEAPLYFEDHLEEIRGKVVLLNERRNLLKLAREGYQSRLAELGLEVDNMRAELDPERAEAPPADWIRELVRKQEKQINSLSAAIGQEARHLAELKQLYYDAQFARLELILSEFDLQIAMARVPRPEIEQLVGIGNDQEVKDTMLGEIERLRESWKARSELLQRSAMTSRRMLARIDPAQQIAVEGDSLSAPEQLGFMLEVPTLPAPGSVAVYDELDPEVQVEMSVLQSRLVVAESELSMLERSMAGLAGAEKHVRSGGVPDWANLPSMAMDAASLDLARADDLAREQDVALACMRPTSAAQLMLALAVSFGANGEARQLPEELSQYKEFDAERREVEYGLLAVEFALRPDAQGTAELASLGDESLAEHDERLPAASPRLMINRMRALLDNPHQYGAAAHDLSYLHFMLWYADQVCAEYGISSDYTGGWSTRSFGL